MDIPSQDLFRVSELAYRLYKGKVTDFSDVLDFSCLDANSDVNKQRIEEIPIANPSCLELCVGNPKDLRCFGVKDVPGKLSLCVIL